MDEPKVPVPKAPKVLVGNINRYLRLVYRYRLVVPPGTNIKVTIWYPRLIHRFHPPQKYWYGDEPVHAGTFGVDLRLVF